MSFSLELKVPAEAAFASLVKSVVADAAQRSELSAQQCEAAVDAAVLGFTTIVEQAMAEAREPLRLVAACTPTHFCISIYERGLPIDDVRAHRDPKWSEIAAKVDRAHWHSRGNQGSELRLVLNRPHRLPATDEAQPSVAQDVTPAPLQDYAIRPFQPGDAAGIARAFYLAYGYHYDVPAVYAPERLTELNLLGRYVSIVAVAQDGEIVGHYALARERDEPIADAGGAIVLPAHRGRNLLNLLREAAQREAIRLGLAAYYSEPVTDHGRTQHASESFGAKVCGISLGTVPRSFVAKHMDLSTTTQRQSFMLYVKTLGERERRTIYPPARHREIIRRIYENLGIAVDLREGTPGSERGELRTSIVRADDIGVLTVERVGVDSADLVRQAVDDLRALRRLGGIYATLPLEDPGTPALYEALESEGFFFSWVGPWMLDGQDALHVQMPLTSIDLGALTVVGDFGKELLAYIAAERTRLAPA